jgi:hypothetical protein
MSSPDLLQQDRIGGCRTGGPPLYDEPHLHPAPLDPERNVSDKNGLRCVYRSRVRGHESGCREDHAQADWAELDSIDDYCEGLPSGATRTLVRRWLALLRDGHPTPGGSPYKIGGASYDFYGNLCII